MNSSIFKTRWSSFAIGIALGWASLSACGAITTATPTESTTEVATAPIQQTEASTQALTQPPQQPATESTFDTVKARGTLKCGVNPGLPGFSAVDAGGANRGFDVDFCRAIAAAMFGDPEKVE